MNLRHPPQAIVFDLGAVIVDIDFERVFAAWAQSAGLPAASIRDRYAVDNAYHQHERGEITAGQYFAHLRDTLTIDLSDDEFERGWNAIFGGEIAGIDERIRRARRFAPCYVFSNTNASHQKFWAREHAATLALFERVFVSNEIGQRKPDQAAFEQVCGLIGSRPSDTWFFDDSAENVAGARATGLYAVQVLSNVDIDLALDLLAPMR